MAGQSHNFRQQMGFPSILARQQMAHPNFRGRPSEASRATWARDRAQLPFFLCNPSGKMTCKIWPAKSGLAVSGSLNVRGWAAHNNPFQFRSSPKLVPCPTQLASHGAVWGQPWSRKVRERKKVRVPWRTPMITWLVCTLMGRSHIYTSVNP